MWRPELNRDKFKQVVLFLLNSPANNIFLGKVKLMKLLYYIDFDHVQRYHAPITGDMYRKLPYGPVPEHGEEILEEMRQERLIEISESSCYGYRQFRFEPRQKPNLDVFSRSEMEVLVQVANKWAPHSAAEIVAASHGEPPWKAVNLGEEIPYSLAFYRGRQLVDSDEEAYDQFLAEEKVSS